MSDEPKKLTVSDPVDADTLQKFAEIAKAKGNIGHRMLSLEQEKVSLLRAASQLDVEERKLFETILISRGLGPNTAVSLDGSTGQLTVDKVD